MEKKSGRDKIKTGICDYLIEHGCLSDYIGFAILCDVLKTALENFIELSVNLKSIYLAVAQKRKITRLCVERNLQTLIENWKHDPKFKTLFPVPPTNAKCINILARKLRYLNCSVYDTLLMP